MGWWIGGLLVAGLMFLAPILGYLSSPWAAFWVSGKNAIPPPIVFEVGGSVVTGDIPVGAGPVSDAVRYQLARQAGFTHEDAVLAVAISIAENGTGNPAAQSQQNQDGTYDLGLWQINTRWWAQFGGRDALVDPWRNAQAAYSIKGRQGFCAWFTYDRNCGPNHTSSYRQYLPRAEAAALVQNVQRPPDEGERLMAAITPWMNVRYQLGGCTGTGIDCSCFTQLVFQKLGVSIPRTAQMQWDATTRVSQPEVGDLVFFHSTYATSDYITHVGIYMGGETMISAATPAVGRQSILSQYWQQHLAGFGRIRRPVVPGQA